MYSTSIQFQLYGTRQAPYDLVQKFVEGLPDNIFASPKSKFEIIPKVIYYFVFNDNDSLLLCILSRRIGFINFNLSRCYRHHKMIISYIIKVNYVKYMKRTKCVAFHSYKGGTGKTTIASNLAGLLVRKGYRVCLLDLDVYAPSLQSYFQIRPQKWINNYLDSNADVGEVMIDLTDIIEKNGVTTMGGAKDSNLNSTLSTKGKLWVGFSSSKKEEIQKLEGSGGTGNRKQFLRKFMLLREQLVSDYDADYILVDTSPGIRQWSINVLAVADILLLTLKMGDLDVDGTKKIVEEVYNIFTGFGTPSFLLCNRVAGYCVPHSYSISKNAQGIIELQKQEETDLTNVLSNQIGMKIISSIPCYCDIQFLKKEFLTVLKYPEHPFTIQLEKLIESLLL